MADRHAGNNGEPSKREIQGAHFRRYGETFISADDSDTRPTLTMDQLSQLLAILATPEESSRSVGLSEREERQGKQGCDER